MDQAQRFVPIDRRRRHTLSVAETAPHEPARMKNAQPLGRAAQPTQDGPAIVASKIHRTIKSFGP